MPKTLLQLFSEADARMAPGPDTLLSTTQVATEFGKARQSVLRAIKNGTLPAQRIGRAWVIRHADARKWAKKGLRNRRPRS